MRERTARPSRRSLRRLQQGAICLSILLCTAATAEIHTRIDASGQVHLTNNARRTAVVHSPIELSRPYHDLVRNAAREYGVSRSLIHAVILAESGYRADAVSHRGAAGLMQLMPETAKRYGVLDPLDPAQNIRGGVQYLRDLLRMFRNDVGLAVAAYNAGEGSVLRYGGIPPYPETARYVLRVLHHYRP